MSADQLFAALHSSGFAFNLRQVGAIAGAAIIAISSARSAIVFIQAGRVFWGSCNFVAGLTSMVFWRQLFGG